MTARARMLNRSADVARRRRLVSPFGPDSIDDATEVYGPIETNTLPFDPDLLCEHSPASCLRSRVVVCAECGEVL